MKYRLLILLIFILNTVSKAQDYKLFSPDGSIKITVFNDDGIHYSVTKDTEIIVNKSKIELNSDLINSGSFKKIVKNEISYSAVITEVNLFEYQGMFLSKDTLGFKAVFLNIPRKKPNSLLEDCDFWTFHNFLKN